VGVARSAGGVRHNAIRSHGILAKRNRRSHADHNGQHDGEHGEDADIGIADSPALDLCARAAKDRRALDVSQLAATRPLARDGRSEVFPVVWTPVAQLPAARLTVEVYRHRT